MASENFANTVIDNATANAQEQSGPAPYSQHLLDAIPGMGQAALFQTNRISNTVLRGGFAPGAKGGGIRQAARNNNYFRKSTWSRMSDHRYLEGSGPLGGLLGGDYSPLQGSGIGNYIGRSVQGVGDTKLGRWLPKDWQAKNAAKLGGGEVFSRGGLGRFMAASKVGNMSEKKFGKLMSTARPAGFVGPLPSHLGSKYGIASDFSKGDVQRRLLTSGSGSISQAVGGFTSAFAEGGAYGGKGAAAAKGFVRTPYSLKGAKLASKWGGEIGLKAGKKVTTTGIMRATASAVRKAGLKGGGTRLAAKGATMMGARAGLVMGGPVGWAAMAALTVYDAVKLTTATIGYMGRTASEGFQSFNSGLLGPDINSPRFTDTAASATSRARGVAAIQNSRMNARSALGSEAGAVAAYYG